ncbi:hypothetical protein C8J57DRAFT_1221488 [Mycena rebaudengoi]|nr:hypothetical protein C8J57DRAFT_1221488 [Mycena rebaudengoi]
MVGAAPAKKKRGNPGDFQGMRLMFLETHIPHYLDASKAKNGSSQSGKSQSLARFWETLFKMYLRKFPWCLNLSEEPVLIEGAEDEAYEAVLANKDDAEAEREELTDNERTEKKTRTGTLQKVRARFKLEKGSEQLAALQLNLRCDIARALLEEEPEDVKVRIRQETIEEHAELLAEHKEACEGTPSTDPENQEDLCEYTGHNISLIAGAVDLTGEKPAFKITAIHVGKTTGIASKLPKRKAGPHQQSRHWRLTSGTRRDTQEPWGSSPNFYGLFVVNDVISLLVGKGIGCVRIRD